MSQVGHREAGRRSRTTIREIAELAGVSIATVSRVVNGRGYVSDETRRAVERVVREHGYSANRNARGLSGGRTGLVGVTRAADPPGLLLGDRRRRRRGALRARHADRRSARPCTSTTARSRCSSALMHGTTDGGLLVLPEESSERAAHADRPRLPLRRRRSARADSPTHPDGLRRALLRRRPGDHATCSASATAASRAITGPTRLDGDRGAPARLPRRARRRRRAARPELVLESNFRFEGGREAAARLLDLPDPPTAIFAFNDQLAIGAMQAALERGLRFPRTSRSSASTTPPRRRSSRRR